MNNNETIKKLQEMKLPVFVKHFREQLHSPELYSSMTFAERLALIVDAEFDARQNNKIKRLLKQSKIPDTSAYLGGIEYLPDRHLNREIFQLLQTNEYLRKGLNIMLIGATGSGKTYIACALGNHACLSEYRTRYFRLSEFFGEIEAAKVQGIYNETMQSYRKIPLMILDDFLLLPTTQEQQSDLLILLRARDEDHSSTILCSQISKEGWHARLGSGGVADTLLDRMTSNGYEIIIGGDVSMRKRHSRTKS